MLGLPDQTGNPTSPLQARKSTDTAKRSAWSKPVEYAVINYKNCETDVDRRQNASKDVDNKKGWGRPMK